MKSKKENFINLLNENSKKNTSSSYEVSFKMWLAAVIGRYMNKKKYNQKEMASFLGKTETQLSSILNADANITIKTIGEILSKIEYLDDIYIHNLVRPIKIKNNTPKFIVGPDEVQVESSQIFANVERV